MTHEGTIGDRDVCVCVATMYMMTIGNQLSKELPGEQEPKGQIWLQYSLEVHIGSGSVNHCKDSNEIWNCCRSKRQITA